MRGFRIAWRLGIIGGGAALLLILVWWLRRPTVAAAEAELRAGNLAVAETIANRLVLRDSKDLSAWKLLGRIREERRDLPGAAAAYRSAADLNSALSDVRLREAMCWLQSARLEDCERALRAVLATKPDDETAQTELQWLLFNQLRSRELETFLEGILERNPANFRVLYHLLQSNQRPPNPRETVGKMEQVQQMHPGQPSIELALGRCYWKLGEPQRARPLLESAQRQLPNNLEAAFTWAEFNFEADDVPAAQAALDRVAAAGQADDRWWWLSGRLQNYRGEVSAAIQSLTRATELRGREIAYRTTLATWLHTTGQVDAAREQHERVQQMRQADQQLYIIVSRGDLERPHQRLYAKLATLCTVLERPIQADGWRRLSAVSP